MSRAWSSLAWALLLASLAACGDSLAPPPQVPPLPEPPLPRGPLANKPAPAELLPEEGAARALSRFLRALDQGKPRAAAGYLDPDGGDQVRALREELLRPGPKTLDRIQEFFPRPNIPTPKPRLLDENRVSFRLPMGPGGKRLLEARFHHKKNGLWLLHLLKALDRP